MTRREIFNTVAATPIATVALALGETNADTDTAAHGLLPYARRALAATTPSSDAALLQLGQEWDQALAGWRAADQHRDELSACYQRVVEPDAVFWRESDAELWDASIARPEKFAGELTGRRDYLHIDTVLGMRISLEALRSQDDFFLGKRLRDRRIARLEEILNTHDAWVADRSRAWVSAGMEDAERACDAAYANLVAVRQQIMLTNAETETGLRVKIRVAIWCFGETPTDFEGGIREALKDDEVPTGERLACSILLDLVRLKPSLTMKA